MMAEECTTFISDTNEIVYASNPKSTVYNKINEMSFWASGVECRIRGRVRSIRSQSKIIFLVLNQNSFTIQCIYFKKDKTDAMAAMIETIPKESIVDIVATTKNAKPSVKSCTIQHIELDIKSVNIVSKSEQILPIQIDEHIYLPEKTDNNNSMERESKLVTRLNNRVVDLRRNDNQFIFRIQSSVSRIVRRFLEKNNFMEIHTPKLIPTASEGGANIFGVNYFGQNAYLAQSPQLYKQMAICADFPRVYEIGPVFRAENSHTHRHLTEFTGIDLEMVIEKDYHEILDLFDRLFNKLFHELNTLYSKELESFWKDFSVEPFEYTNPCTRIKFREAVKLLTDAGVKMTDDEDFNTEKERALGRIVKEKYHTDFFMVDEFPTSVRPFYTMPSPDDPSYSHSYDFFIRGEEVLSGAQRINDYQMLVASASSHGISLEKIRDYLESFRYGTYPHGGGGIGLERVVMLYLGINNIRNVSMFPRDPTRFHP